MSYPPYNKIDLTKSEKMKKRYITRIEKADSLTKVTQIMHQIEYVMSLSREDYDYLYKLLLDKREALS